METVRNRELSVPRGSTVFPSGSVNSARYIPRRFAFRYKLSLFTSPSVDSCIIFLYYSMLYYKHRHTSPGCYTQQSSILGGFALPSNALTFYIPFLTEKVPFRTPSIDKTQRDTVTTNHQNPKNSNAAHYKIGEENWVC